MIVLDTSVLVAALTGERVLMPKLARVIERGERMVVPALVLFEWLRGPRMARELARQEKLFPTASALPFGPDEAAMAADLYRSVSNPRRREADLAVAAQALMRKASLWSLNTRDFADIPGLRLHSA